MARLEIIEQTVAAAILLTAVNCAWGARILAIYPMPSYSHQIVFNQFTEELHRRGHEIVVLTPNPILHESSKNFTQIDISFTYKDIVGVDFMGLREGHQLIPFLKAYWDVVDQMVREIYEVPEFRKLYAPDSEEKFDLVIIEMLMHQGLFGVAHRFDAPLIGITTLGLGVPFNYVMGNPIMTSHPSVWELESRAGTNLPLWRRIRNFVEIWTYYYEFQSTHLVRQNIISKKYLGKDTPDIGDIQKNISLLLVNQDPAISYVRPNVPNVIQFGSFHISKKMKPLPKDLKDFLDGATEGFVYMSLGSNVKSKFLPNKTKEMFFQVFSHLPQRVLWKFEDDLHVDSENVFISNWVPQQTVLNHPNIKLFVYQGGLQSTEEAIHFEVPLLGLPVFSDQDSQVKKLVDYGVAKCLELTTLEKVEFEQTLREVIADKSYKQNMAKLNAFVKDKPYDPLQNALWWLEFVIRHKGAPHLRSSTVDEAWYERSDMDVIVVLTLASFLTFIIVSLITVKLIILSFQLFKKLSLTKKTKIP